ncbi:MAG: hypothetical protein IJ806_08830 [Ruminococcus sp.]|nr:hypothetical protein [Ruminococcus sp.]
MDGGIETPFGMIEVWPKRAAACAGYSCKKYIFRNGHEAQLYTVSLDLPEDFCEEIGLGIRGGDGFSYYDSDEHSLMVSCSDAVYCTALIAFDPFPDPGPRPSPTRQGLLFHCEKGGGHIHARVLTVPADRDFAAAELIDTELC